MKTKPKLRAKKAKSMKAEKVIAEKNEQIMMLQAEINRLQCNIKNLHDQLACLEDEKAKDLAEMSYHNRK